MADALKAAVTKHPDHTVAITNGAPRVLKYKHRKLRTYFAGNIAKNDWRHDIADDLRSEALAGDEANDWLYTGKEHLIATRSDDVLYCGPYFVGCDHGCFHGPGQHGAWTTIPEPHPGDGDKVRNIRKRVYAANIQRIYNCDVVFAYISKPDAEGTKYELGLATGFNKPVFLYYSPDLSHRFVDDCWFHQIGARDWAVADVHDAFERFTAHICVRAH